MQKFWSERIIFGIMLIGGYLVLCFGVMWKSDMVPDQRQLIRDAMLVLGPLLGMIVQAIWRTDKADKDNAATTRALVEKLPPAPSPTDGSNSPPAGSFDATISPISESGPESPPALDESGDAGASAKPAWNRR